MVSATGSILEMQVSDLDDRTRLRIERVLGRRVTAYRQVPTGYTPAGRWLVQLDDGSSAFAKQGQNLEHSELATWLRTESRVYESLAGDFLPRRLAFDDDGDSCLLLLEDASSWHWPPPWGAARVDAVLGMLGRLAAAPCPDWISPLEEFADELGGWSRVAVDPEPFLGLELVSRAWLDRHLQELLACERGVALSGDSIVHLDVRSDNLCLQGDRVLLVDWNWVRRGDARVDLAFWLPSLYAEGGPAPWEILPRSGGLSALLSGFFAARAGLPPLPQVPQLRPLQLTQLQAALPWAARELGLDAPDGLGARRSSP